MKKLGLIVALFFLLAGCMVMPIYAPFNKQSIEQGGEMTAGIGDVFFEHSEGQEMKDIARPKAEGQVASGSKYELTIVELNQEKVGLQYNEFTFTSSVAVGYSYIPGGWAVKQGFNKRFDYAIADKVIRFKGYEFEVVSVEKGQIKYKRVK